jgi:hypothetical protein
MLPQDLNVMRFSRIGTPLQEALQVLSAEGLVCLVPKKGPGVVHVARKENGRNRSRAMECSRRSSESLPANQGSIARAVNAQHVASSLIRPRRVADQAVTISAGWAGTKRECPLDQLDQNSRQQPDQGRSSLQGCPSQMLA